MKIFMDTAIVEEIKQFVDMGIVYGVTTNPSLVAKSGPGDLPSRSGPCQRGGD